MAVCWLKENCITLANGELLRRLSPRFLFCENEVKNNADCESSGLKNHAEAEQNWIFVDNMMHKSRAIGKNTFLTVERMVFAHMQ